MKYLGEYHDFYDQSNTLLLKYVFEDFRIMFLEICELDPVFFNAIHQYPKANNKYTKY